MTGARALHRLLALLALVSLALVFLGAGCGITRPGANSETHFLRSCETDTDCGGLVCICNVCTESCEESNDCSALSSNATCIRSGCGLPACDVRCASSSDCVDLGLACQDAVCRVEGQGASGDSSEGLLSGNDRGGQGGASMEASCAPLPTGLVAWWRGEQDATDAAGAFDGNLEGGTTFAGGVSGSAFHFDGVDDIVSVTGFPDVGAGSFTFAYWVRTSSNTGLRIIADERTGDGLAGSTAGWVVYQTDGRASIQLNDGTTQRSFDGLNFVADDAWHHVAISLVRTPTDDTVIWYIDGVEVDRTMPTEMIASPIESDGPLHLSGSTVDDGPGLVGELDEVQYFDRALDAAEIRALFDLPELGACP